MKGRERNRTMILVCLVSGLVGCATTGGEPQSLRANQAGSTEATQASAQTIAPITSYIGNM